MQDEDAYAVICAITHGGRRKINWFAYPKNHMNSRLTHNKKILIKKNVNLKETIVLTPDASTISTSIEIVGDLLRNVEESIKEISLTADYVKLAGGICTLVFLSALGRVMSLPLLLVLGHVTAFTVPYFYVKNQDKIDQVLQSSMEAAEMFLEKNFQIKLKLQ